MTPFFLSTFKTKPHCLLMLINYIYLLKYIFLIIYPRRNAIFCQYPKIKTYQFASKTSIADR